MVLDRGPVDCSRGDLLLLTRLRPVIAQQPLKTFQVPGKASVQSDPDQTWINDGYGEMNKRRRHSIHTLILLNRQLEQPFPGFPQYTMVDLGRYVSSRFWPALSFGNGSFWRMRRKTGGSNSSSNK